jgi:hypothetical protein
VRAKAPLQHASPAVRLGVEVGTVITVLTVDDALQDTCAIFREKADQGDITTAERDLLIDGAILLAMRIDEQAAQTASSRRN